MPTLSLNASKKTKHTPAGEIPVDWGCVQMKDCAVFVGGAQPPQSTFIFEPRPGYVRLLQIRDYKSDRNATYIPENLSRRSCTEEDIMIGRYGPPIFQILRGKRGSYNVALIKAQPTPLVDREYLFLLLKQDSLFRLIDTLSARTSGQTGIDMEALKTFPVPLPPLPEQIRIAAILSTWDRAIETLESLIAAKDRRKQALMQQLLTGRKRLPGFGGKLPIKHLGEVARNVSLRNNGRFGWDRLYAVTKAEGMIPMREQVMGITTKNCKLVKRGNFAYNPMRLNIGSLARWQKDEEVMVSGDYIVFECIEGALEPRFFDHLRRTPGWHDFVNTGGSGSVRVRLYFKDIAPFRFPCPSYKEQEALADLFDTIDRELALHRQHLATLRTQKRGLMQKLLTGEVRVEP